MLTRILFLVFATLISHIAFSQDETGYKTPAFQGSWSVSYNLGPVIDYENNTGHKLSMEVGYLETESHEFLLNISTSSLALNHFNSYSFIECSVAPRIFPLNTKRFFVEGNIGAQINTKIHEYYYRDFDYEHTYLSKETRSCFYFAAGIEVKVPVSVNNSFLLRLKYNTTMPSSEGLTYFTGQFGLNFAGNEKPSGKTKRKLSVSFGGGVNSPLDNNWYKNSGKGLLFAEGSYRTSPKTEIYTELSFNKIDVNQRETRSKFLSLNFGPRLYLNKNAFSSFFEFGAGAYLLTINDSREYDPFNIGISVGTGFTVAVNKLVELVLKGKIHLVLTQNPSFPPYSCMSGGVRFNL